MTDSTPFKNNFHFSEAGNSEDSLELRGRVTLVTGGSRGIGRAVVERLAEQGSHVAVNYRSNEAAAEAVVASARAKGVEALAVKSDVANVAEANRMVQMVLDRFGRLDILVCNAGIWEGSPVEEMAEEVWDRAMDINLRGTWTVCRAAVPIMKQQRFGRIVILASTAGQRGEAGYSNYAASKGGQIAFTKSLASELGGFGINVNAVAPGWVDTDMTAEALDEAGRERVAKEIPVGKIATADDIAFPIVFLCSEWARHITGEILNVNGGAVLCG